MEATIPEALDQLAGVLAGGGLTVFTACLLGRVAIGSLRHLRGQLTAAEGWLLSFACGSALLSVLVFALCALRWFTDAAVLVVAAGALACWLRWGRWTWPGLRQETPAPPRHWRMLLLAPAALYGVLYAVHTLAPETRTDAMGYHLGLVQRYYRAHGFVPLTTNIYAHISQGAEMLFLFAYSIGRESAAKIVHFSYLVATAGAILCLARRFKAGLAGVFATVVYFTCPVVIPDATSTYNDCALTFTLLCTFYIFWVWRKHPNREWLVLLGLLAGYSFAIKYTGWIAVAAPLAAAASIAARRKDWRAAASGLALCAVPAAAVGLPWLVKSAVITGNPLAPFFNDWFPNPYVSLEWESAYTFAMRSYQQGPFNRWEQLLEAPFDLVLGRRYAGSVGWMALLLPIGALAWRTPPARWLLAAAAVTALPWLSNAGARFLIPSLLFATLAAGLALDLLPRRARLATVAALLTFQCASSWPAHRGFWYHPSLWSVEGFPWRAALGLEPPKWHLARNVESFLLADRLDKLGGAETRVLSFGNLPEAYFQAELLVSYQGLENQDLADAILAAVDPAKLPGSALRATWPALEASGLRVAQAGASRGMPWLVSEIRPLRDGRRTSSASTVASWSDPLRWHSGRAFDGDIFTVWNSREPAATGMVIEARFGRSVSIDGLEVVHPRSSARLQAQLVFAALDGSGKWERIAPETAKLIRLPVDTREAKRAAGSLLRRHRIAYVVINVDRRDPYFRETRVIASDPAAWGLRKVFVDRSAILLEVVPDAD